MKLIRRRRNVWRHFTFTNDEKTIRTVFGVCVYMAGAKRMSYFSDIIFIIFHNLLCSKGGIIAIADFPQDN